MRVKVISSVLAPPEISVRSWTASADSASLFTSFCSTRGVVCLTSGTTWLGGHGRPARSRVAVRVTAEKMGLVPSRRNIIALNTQSHRTSFR